MSSRPGVWVIVRTELKHEAKVYRAMVDMGHDAWLPQMPRITRAHRTVKHRREWWKPTMPTVFFAKVNPFDLMHLTFIPYFRGIERKTSGETIVLVEEVLFNFRKRIDAENREILRTGAAIEPKAPHVKPSRPSKRIRRPGPKRPRISEQLVAYTDRLIKGARAPSCDSGEVVLCTDTDRMCPDPQATC